MIINFKNLDKFKVDRTFWNIFKKRGLYKSLHNTNKTIKAFKNDTLKKRDKEGSYTLTYGNTAIIINNPKKFYKIFTNVEKMLRYQLFR